MPNLPSTSAGVLFSSANNPSSPAPGAPPPPALLSAPAPALRAPAAPTVRATGAAAGHTASVAPARPARVAPRQNLRHVIIKQQVQITLDLQRPSFTMWRRLFIVTLGQFGVLAHVDDDAPPQHDDPEWVQDDYTIVSWLYSTVSEEILSLIMTPDDTSFAVWRRIENLFLDNAVTRAVYLDDEFHGQKQGNLTVSAYCSRLKSLADRLRDLGRPVTDADLVHRVLAGLRSDFRHAVTTLSREVPLPSFQDVRSFLVLEEGRNEDADPSPSGTALHAAAAPPPPPAAPTLPVPAPPPPAPPTAKPKTGGWHKTSGRTKTTSMPPAPSAAAAPWTGMVQAWPYQWRPHYPGAGVLGPRPTGAPPTTGASFAGAAFHQAAPTFHGTTGPVYQAHTYQPPPGASVPCWDQAGLIHALQQLSVQQQHPAGGEWVMDTGATSHMTSSPGSTYPPGAPPM
uniref:Uncharacterized protein n=1 Tax=Avena sativa TaxID=4498 RepID=A0ACD5WC87_AVESA